MGRVPRFEAFRASSETASRIKQRNRAKDTRAEVLLRKELWKRGLRYRLHSQSLPGRPDLVFTAARVVVFCDGDFWHGRDWDRRLPKLMKGSNGKYWAAKIQSNRERDLRVTTALQDEGWIVMRFWETDIVRDLDSIADAVEQKVRANAPTAVSA